MNPKLKEINELITLCDQMLFFIQEHGDIHPNNDLYLSYKFKVNSFCKENKINNGSYAPYAVLCTFYFKSSAYTVNRSEVLAIKNALIEIKHTLFKDDYEKSLSVIVKLIKIKSMPLWISFMPLAYRVQQ